MSHKLYINKQYFHCHIVKLCKQINIHRNFYDKNEKFEISLIQKNNFFYGSFDQ